MKLFQTNCITMIVEDDPQHVESESERIKSELEGNGWIVQLQRYDDAAVITANIGFTVRKELEE